MALQLYRVGLLVLAAWIIRTHHARLRVGGLVPVTVAEVKSIYPAAARLDLDLGERAGWFVKDADGGGLGYVVRTSPISDEIVGYRGWTDTLIGFDPALRVLAVRIRSSQDTRDHVADVRDDRTFLKTWNGQSWDEVARTTPESAGIEGVSGATKTSVAIAEGIQRRLAAANTALAQQASPLRVGIHDVGLALVLVSAVTLSFTGTQRRPWLRRSFQVIVVGYIGFVTGDLLAQSLVVGWAQAGVPWRASPGLALLLATSLIAPAASGKPLYCHHLCPHGAVQEWLARAVPHRWRLPLPKRFAAGLRWLPPLLLAAVIAISMLLLPIDLADLEAFDAYIVRSAGWATIGIAIGGLLASLFVPMAYCHYGCPTGALLNFLRARGATDRFGRRDAAAALLVAFAALLAWQYGAIHAWMIAD